MAVRCKFNECKKEATKNWALVPLCWRHHQAIRREQIQYYKGMITSAERVTFNMIKYLTPEGKRKEWR